MALILSDPNLDICPDYASAEFTYEREQLTGEHLTEAQAIHILTNIWTSGNNAAKLRWQAQLEESNQRRQHRLQQEEDERERQDQERREEEEISKKEDKKKYKYKYTPIPDRDVPTETPTLPSPYAVKKLEKGEYVELWYFTNDGLDDVHLKTSIDDDAMIMARLPDGSTGWVSAATARNAQSVIEDHKLPFEDFCQASPRMIQAMEEAGWPADRVKMMALFFRNLQIHEYRSIRDPLAQKALLLYQAEQRKKWHLAVKTARGAYDLSRINNELLERTRSRVYFEDREKKDNDRDYRVSPPCFPQPQRNVR